MQTQDNNEVLAYWLSNASTLLLLLQRTLKASGSTGMAPQRRRSSSATLFGRMTQVYVHIFCPPFTLFFFNSSFSVNEEICYFLSNFRASEEPHKV